MVWVLDSLSRDRGSHSQSQCSQVKPWFHVKIKTKPNATKAHIHQSKEMYYSTK